jgi:N-glycosylase/DNA lyase
VIRAPLFDLRRTLESGQFFRWTREGEGYLVQTGGRLFRVAQEADRLRAEGAGAAFLRRFFSLDHDLEGVEEALRRDAKLRPALDAYRGLRLLRQDPWECTAAFIVSIASNIPRITGNVADLARRYGRPVRLDGFAGHAFPRPGELGPEAELRRLRLGFRAKYLVEADRLASAGLLREVEGEPYEAAKEKLMTIPGVAEKVADCVLLFAFGHRNAFPVDTWIRRVMRTTYFGGRGVTDRVIRAFAVDRWGPHAGYAQQYLYVWSRANPLPGDGGRASP